MNLAVFTKRVVTASIVAFAVVGGVRTRDVVHARGQAVPVLRTPGDGLDSLASKDIAFGSDDALAASCDWNDTRKACCPAACAADKHKGSSDDGIKVLRACIQGLGCNYADSWHMSDCRDRGYGC
jgi:hypothetical protein